MSADATCAFEGCPGPRRARGWCFTHYKRWQRENGPRPILTLAERLLARSEVVEGGCRRWRGAHVQGGYGHIKVAGRPRGVHAVAYEVWIGPMPDGHEIDHVRARGCRYRDCIEPTHLEAVTHAENMARTRRRERPRG